MEMIGRGADFVVLWMKVIFSSCRFAVRIKYNGFYKESYSVCFSTFIMAEGLVVCVVERL
jgi:hypothetical protein